MAKLSVEMASENFNIKSLIILLIDKELDIQKGAQVAYLASGAENQTD